MTKTFTFAAKVWLYPGKAAWHFVTLPPELAHEINYYFSHAKRGWGSLPVEVSCGEVTWETSIFPDKHSASYLLPLKSAARQKTQLHEGEMGTFVLKISD